MSAGSVAFDQVNLSRRLDNIDPSFGPYHRNNHSSWALLQAINSWLLEVREPGATLFRMGEEWAEADRTAYETAIGDAQTAITAALSAFKTIVKQ